MAVLDHSDVIPTNTITATPGAALTRIAICCGFAAAVLTGITLATAGHAGIHEHLGRATAVLIVTAAVLGGQVVLRRDLHRNRHAIATMVRVMAEADVRHQAELHRMLHELAHAARRYDQAVREAREEGRVHGRTEIKQIASAQIAELQEQYERQLEQATKEAEERGEARGYARGLDAAARIDAEESAPRPNRIVRRIPPPR